MKEISGEKLIHRLVKYLLIVKKSLEKAKLGNTRRNILEISG
jgi:hypothetical protein